MLVPLSWIREYIDDELTTSELAERLTASGSSVERIHEVGQGLDDLIVGEVVSVKPHPNADRLRLAQVNTGTETVDVVCGAPNLAPGQHIVYAAEGSLIPVDMHAPDRKPFRLKKAKIRGVESNGMICSVAELGIGEDHDGILELPNTTEIGQPVREALGFPQTVFDIEVTTNRSDELSMIGIAREVSALTSKLMVEPDHQNIPASGSEGYDPVIETDHCYRLMTQQLQVTVGPSPWWMQQRLSLAGMRPVNNIVDITNYVMLEYGQPMHAYDVTKLEGDSIVVRQAHPNESLETLDGVKRQLNSDIMIIADKQKPLAIAGIMGGESSKISENTQTIVLEVAAFDPVAIRQASNHLALRSEASRRFERTVNREMCEVALNRAVALLSQYAKGSNISKRRNSYPQPLELKQITLTSKRLYQYLGKSITPLEVRQVLKSLGFGDTSAFGKDDDWEIAAKVPSWRASDVHEEVDLIEEVVRIIGYDTIPVKLPDGDLPTALRNSTLIRQQRLRIQLSQLGWMDTINLPLTGREVQAQAGLDLPDIAIANPLSSEWTHMRNSLLPGLFQIAKKNIRQTGVLKMFELGNVHVSGDSTLPRQEMHLGLIFAGQVSAEEALGITKGALEHSILALGIASGRISYAKAPSNYKGGLDPNNCAEIRIEGNAVGHVGAIPRVIREALDLPQGTIAAEMNTSSLLGEVSNTQFKVLGKYPSIEEDLSLLMPEDVSLGTIISLIKEAGGELVESVSWREIYRDAKLGDGTKSPTIHLVYRSDQKTLSSQDVSKVRARIIEALNKENINVRS